VGSEPLILVDTHVLVWWLNGTPPLSAKARKALRGSSRDAPVFASTISVFEICTAVRRGRLTLAVPIDQWLSDLALLPELQFQPLTLEIARIAGGFDDTVPGDPADRLIAATAISLGAKLVTADVRLRKMPHLQTVW
jgi:PIN domain nuclease of toxin-antitoxin system